jgi:glycosyltransferase involved in cell wall biosynthesis
MQKRTQDLPLIAAALRARGIAAEITVIGTGTDDDGTMGTTDGIHHAGPVSNDEVMRMLSECDVFVLTSSFEGLPVSVLEAMERACVPIVTDIRSGVPQLVENGVNGFVVPVGGIDEFADRIALLSSDPVRLERMRAAARQTVVQCHDIENVATRFLEMLSAVASDTSVRPRGRIVVPQLLEGVPTRVPALALRLRKALSAFRAGAR